MAPHALTTHFKDYRILRTPDGLALSNCALGEGDIDLPAIVDLLAKHNPAINLNIEIHSQFAPFRHDIVHRGYWSHHPAPPGDGLAWYLEKAWTRPLLDPWPEDMPDGQSSWQRESQDLEQSVKWARSTLGHLIN